MRVVILASCTGIEWPGGVDANANPAGVRAEVHGWEDVRQQAANMTH